MITITRLMDGHDIAQQIRMERQVLRKVSFLLLEGDTDIKRFDRYIDEAVCSPVNCYGRDNAIEATELLYDDGFAGALAVVDADFDRVCNSLNVHEGIIYSETHDLDLDWSIPDIVGRYINEVGDKSKWTSHGSAAEIIDKILLGLKPISVARLLNHQKQITYKLSGINADKCFANFAVDVDAYLDLVFEGRAVSTATRDALKQKIVSAAAKTYDLRQLTNGHDFHCALGACLRGTLGARAIPQTWGKEVESHLRLSCDEAEFRTMSVYFGIREWAQDNAPFRVFKASLT
jgi:hypothetical protein